MNASASQPELRPADAADGVAAADAQQSPPKEAPQAPDEPKPVEPGCPVDALQAGVVEAQVVETLRTVYDPEIPVNIYELGMIYGIDVTPDRDVKVRMTLTSPACPVAGSLPGEVETRVRSIPGVRSAKIDLVWDPPWTPEKMSEAAKLQLGWV